MDIIFFRYNSICESDIINVLKRLGHNVHEINDHDLSEQDEVRILSAALDHNKCDFVFSINFFPIVSEVCRIYHKVYVSWIVDSPVMELYSHYIRNKTNRVFMFDYALYEEFKNENPGCIFYMPLAADPTRLDSVISSISAADEKNFSSDISFIGSLYSEKSPYHRLKDNGYVKGYLDGLIEAQLKVYGYNFLIECLPDEIIEEFKKKTPFYQFPENATANDRAALAHLYLGNRVSELERHRLLRAISERFKLNLYTASDVSALPKVNFKGLASSLIEMPKIFHLSKINLNFTSKPIQTGIPQRIWDIMSAGGFVLTNYQTELTDYFEIGKHIEVFSSETELLDKIQYYLEHEDERKEIANNGYQLVKESHSLEQRLSTLMSYI